MYQEIADILGLKTRKRSGSLEIARSIEEGFPASSIDRLKRDLGMTDRMLSNLVGKTPKTLGRMRGERARLLPGVSDRLFRIARIYAHAIEVFESKDAAREWLNSPQIGLANRIPMDLLATEAGAQAITELLTRIDHGVLA